MKTRCSGRHELERELSEDEGDVVVEVNWRGSEVRMEIYQ